MQSVLARRSGVSALSVAPLAFMAVAMVAVACRPQSASNTRASTSTTASLSSSPTPAHDEAAAAALGEFRSAIKAASPGQWSILKTTALAASDRGAWDDFRVGSPVVMRDSGPSRYRMWFIGCRLAAEHYDCGVGHARSVDGVEWIRADSPVFVPPDLPAPHWLGTLAIVKAADRYLMWYSLDGDRFANRPLGTLYMATSADGLEWQNAGPVHTATGRRTIRHAVHQYGQAYHLWYADATDDGAESFLHFTSPDGKTWTAAGGDTLDGRASSVGRPWVTADGRAGFRALVLDGSAEPAVRWIVSTDGTTWTSGAEELKAGAARDGTSIVDVSGLQESDGLWLWTTTAVPGAVAESISVIFKKGSAS